MTVGTSRAKEAAPAARGPARMREGAIRVDAVLSRRPGRRTRWREIWPFVVIALTVIAVWSWPVLGDFANLRLANPGDSESFAYYLAWNVHAWLTWQDPFFTPNLYAPDGLDLGNAISMPGVSLLVAPITLAFGGTAGYNAALLLSVFFGGAALYLLARELFNSVGGSLLAAELMIVSPYFVGHALGHLNLMWIFGLPFIAYLIVRRVKGRLGRTWLVLGIGATVGFTAGASTELLMTETLFTLLAYAIALALSRPRLRARLLSALPWTIAGAALGGVLAIPVVLAGLRSGIPDEVFNPPAAYSTDVTNIFAPTNLMWFGESSFAPLVPVWGGNVAEDTAFIPVTLLLVLLVLLRRAGGRMAVGLALFGALALLASFGPMLTIGGVQTITLPWRVAVEIPGLDHVLPGRFSGFVYMAILLLVAQAWKRSTLPRVALLIAVAVAFVLTIPDLNELRFPADARDPEFVTSGEINEVIEPGENVLVLPAGQWGPGMRWQDKLDFSFEMPTGNGGGANLPPALEEPVGKALWDRNFDFDYDDALPRYLEETHVDLVIVDGREQDWVQVVEDAIGEAGAEHDGVVVWDLDK